MAFIKRASSKTTVFPNLDGLSFGLYSSEEIRKMSVLKVVTPLSMNKLGRPLPGGLYDPHLGPSLERTATCMTCCQSSFSCPGHMGHIELPLPVVNPVFRREILSLLRLSCLNCSKLQIPEIAKHLMLTQLELLNAGLIAAALDAENVVMNPDSSLRDQESLGIWAQEKLSNYTQEVLAKEETVKSPSSKVTEALTRMFIERAIKIPGYHKRCYHCRKPMKKLFLYQCRFMSNIPTIEVAQKFAADYLRKIFFEEQKFMEAVYPLLKNTNIEYPTDLFFIDTLPVIPPNMRPVNIIQDRVAEHPHSFTLRIILQGVVVIQNILKAMKDGAESLSTEGQNLLKQMRGKKLTEKLSSCWEELQADVIEKKEGLMRMHMMGKRVNYAARSVITPDPNLNIDEIGIPEDFAMRLTYPTPVTPWNVEELRRMVMNGPKVHPGATMVESEDGSTTILKDNVPLQREAIAKRLLTPSGSFNQYFSGTKIVRFSYRFLIYMNVSNQYLVPKNGTPLSGLIQDHVISGVRLSIRGQFFTRGEYQQLVYQALCSKPGTIFLLKPCMLKPRCLWSGKQVISTVILNVLPRHKAPLSLVDLAKISVKAWNSVPTNCRAGGTPLVGAEMTESEVVIRQGELLCGVLDKKHYGATPFGLIHCIYELYGGSTSSLLLSAFSKLFTAFLQTQGFTLGVADILVLKRADKKRTNVIQQSRQVGDEIVREALELPPDTTHEELVRHMKNAFSNDAQKYCAILDRKFKSALDTYTNEINRTCLPVGLLHKFPENNLQLMVQSGAKGSTVNTMQISCLLGQIELEGKRPPLMISGRSLPSFPPFTTSPRAGGFIDGRFMTGIRPQEFFFHCMAGREGLIDTAVKTSRSGYLQRCLVKHLEGVTVGYDQTVRDSDGSVVQYYYGEDGMDVGKSQFLNKNQIHVLSNNINIVQSKEDMQKINVVEEKLEELEEVKKELSRWKRKNNTTQKYRNGFVMYSERVAESVESLSNVPDKHTGRSEKTKFTVESWRDLDSKTRDKYANKTKNIPDPVSSKFFMGTYFGSLSEKMEKLIAESSADSNDVGKLRELVYHKSMAAQCPPGEPVGILAAQSIGEPSTQMTLNTFHFAGRGDMNVTLGIPRLREVLMMASKNQRTPAMDIPFLPHVSESKAERLRLHFTRVTVADVLEKICVTESIDVGLSRQYTYKIKFCFLPRRVYKTKYPLKPPSILKYMERSFFKLLEMNMKKSINIRCQNIESQSEKKKKKGKSGDDSDEEGDDVQMPGDGGPVALDGEGHLSSDEEMEADDDDATVARQRSRHNEKEYEDPEEEEVEQESDLENVDAGLEDPEAADLPENVDELYRDQSYHEFASRREEVKLNCAFVQSYDYDVKKELSCEVIMGVSLDCKKIDMANVLRETAKKAIIWQVPNINKAFTYRNAEQELILKVDGMNIAEMFKYHNLLDLNRLYTNDIHAFSQIYGIECARRVLVKEVQNVFAVYGITVDPRHLLLVADYMTIDGTYRPLNRSGITDNASPLQQMTFETAISFLKSAVLGNKTDSLKSPSSCLVTGQPCRVGTGTFDLRLRMI
ncbi:hypothetical protein B566_EDAN004063 [Ephemera danica]|nr:hypothetical protein B566_EDAN004063 [Ephemera danica]